MDLAQTPVVGEITEIGEETTNDPSRNVGMDANANSESNERGTDLVQTDVQACIRHAASTVTTTGFDTIPIDIDALEPGSPESPIYVDTLDQSPSPESQRSDSPDIPLGPITHTQLHLSVSTGNETPFCCHIDGTPVRPNKVGGHNKVTSNILTSDVPPGFVKNEGLNFVPFPITDNDGITQHPDYIRIIMIDDPFMLAIIRGNPHVYGQALHIAPRIPDYRRPQYDPSDLVIFRACHDRCNTIDDAVHGLGDKTATAEVHHWRNLMVRRAKME